MKYKTIVLDETGERTDQEPVAAGNIADAIHNHMSEVHWRDRGLPYNATVRDSLITVGFYVTVTDIPAAHFIVTILTRVPSLADAMKDEEVK